MPPVSLPQLVSFLRRLPADILPPGYQRLFGPPVTLYYLILQKLQPQLSLQAVVADLHRGGADALSGPQPLSQKIVSFCTCAYSKARGRLRLATLRRVLHWQAAQAGPRRCSRFWDKEVRLLDGSTLSLRPFGDIPRYFPPHSTTRGQGYWCLMRVVVSFCAQTGLALECATGSKHASEQALACRLWRRAQAGVLYVADRNFGVLSVVQSLIAAQADVVVRLTDKRARKLLGQAPQPGVDTPVRWERSAKDQRVNDTVVLGRVLCLRLERPGFRSLQLCLFTTLLDPALYTAEKLVELYGWRWRIELNLRHLKTELAITTLAAHSARMAIKEWLAALLAYNLVRLFMLAAAQTHNLSVETLSFKLARRLVHQWIVEETSQLPPELLPQRWEILLRTLAGVQPPRRTKPRPSQPRACRYLARSFPSLKGSRSHALQLLQASTKS